MKFIKKLTMSQRLRAKVYSAARSDEKSLDRLVNKAMKDIESFCSKYASIGLCWMEMYSHDKLCFNVEELYNGEFTTPLEWSKFGTRLSARLEEEGITLSIISSDCVEFRW